MRSVHIFLRSARLEEVARYLSKVARRVGKKWLVPGEEEPGLEIGILDDAEDFEEEDIEGVLKSLQQPPGLVLYADVSGQIDGEEEIRGFVRPLLSEFDGVALDDHSSHCWTLAELQEGKTVDGLVFFRGPAS